MKQKFFRFSSKLFSSLSQTSAGTALLKTVSRISPKQLKWRCTRQQLNYVLDVIGEAIVIVDTQLRIVQVNRQSCKISGYSPAEILGKRATLFLAPESVQLYVGRLPQILGERIELEGLKKDGSTFPLEVCITPLRLDKEEGYIFAIHDITTRKQTEEALQQAQIELEERVEARATQLLLLNEALKDEIVQRLKAQENLYKAQVELEERVEARTLELKETNSALQTQMAEREHAEAVLKRERDFIAAVFDTMDSLVIVLDRQGNVVRFNRACEELSGYSFEEVRGQPCWDVLLLPEEAEAVKATFQKLQAGDYPNQHQNYWLTRAGERRWITWANSALVDEQGHTEYIIGTGIDITERRLTEEALKESEQRYRSIIATMEEGVVLQQADSTITACNASAEHILGLTADQMMGRTSLDPRWRSIHEDGSPFPGDTHPAIVTLTTGEPCSNVIMGVHKPGGELTWISINSQPIFGEQATTETQAVVCTFTDITRRKLAEEARRESEERFRQLAENMEDAVWMATPDQSQMLYISPAYEEIWGRSRQSLYDDPKSFMDAIHPDDHERIRSKQAEKTRGLYGEEYRVVRPDGTVRWVWSRAFPVHNERGEVYRIAGVSEDITERKKNERLKNEFISTVSHELRTPLTAIRGSLGLVVGGVAGPIPSQAQMMLDIAYKNSERLILLINDLLDIEKIEAGKLVFNLKVLELMPLVQQALEANKAYAEQYRVTFSLDESLSEAKIKADPDRLMQVFANLLSNAAKFSPTGGNVSIAVNRHNQLIRLSISDQGNGIPDEFRDRIFQKFAQADSSNTRLKGGTGLGLSITKALVEGMGGQINFETRPGHGTTFYFELPEWHDQVLSVGRPTRLGQPRVLVCEDDHDIADLIGILLDESGFSCDLAYNAREARQFLEQGEYAAMTLDLMMPEINGLSFLQELRREPRTEQLPVVVISAWVDTTQQQREINGTALNVLDWVSKPIDQERLIGAISRATHHCASSRPRILHIEDDADLVEVVGVIVQDVAELSRATSLQEARRELQSRCFDLVILDLELPDGSGLELLPLLNQPGPGTPVIIFSIEEVGLETMQRVAATLVKSRTTNQQLFDTIKALVNRVGTTQVKNWDK